MITQSVIEEEGKLEAEGQAEEDEQLKKRKEVNHSTDWLYNNHSKKANIKIFSYVVSVSEFVGFEFCRFFSKMQLQCYINSFIFK